MLAVLFEHKMLCTVHNRRDGEILQQTVLLSVSKTIYFYPPNAGKHFSCHTRTSLCSDPLRRRHCRWHRRYLPQTGEITVKCLSQVHNNVANVRSKLTIINAIHGAPSHPLCCRLSQEQNQMFYHPRNR